MAEPLEGKFDLVASFADERVYSTVRRRRQIAPRLYVVTGIFEQARMIFAAAQANFTNSRPITGLQMRSSLGEEESFVFCQPPASACAAKSWTAQLIFNVATLANLLAFTILSRCDATILSIDAWRRPKSGHPDWNTLVYSLAHTHLEH